jgi:enoyl-[acyl-carrier protein] reductase I
MSTSGLLKGKRGIIFGVANKRSLAWAIAQAAHREGAEIALTYQNERLLENINELAPEIGAKLVLPCEATEEKDLIRVFEAVDREWGRLDFLVHAIAFAKKEELEGEYLKATADGFQLAMNVSAYTLTAMTRIARPLLAKAEKGSSVVALTYLGGEKVMPGYNVMGVAKAALDMSVRYLANDLGAQNIRVNAISAGPVNTLAARGIHGFSEMLKHVRDKAPLKRNIEAQEVGDAAAFLLSDYARGVTGEILHVDAGYNTIAW